MILHRYLEQLLGNRASISILRTLFYHKGMVFTVRKLADIANVSHTEANDTVEKLEKFGILSIQPVGRAHMISLNDKSYVLKSIVEPILIAEEQTLQDLVNVLKKHLTTKKIISSAIFGSVARSKEKEDSDIDLLVISDDFEHATEIIASATENISTIFYSRVSPLIFSKKEFLSKEKTDLVRSIISNHILVTGIELEKLR